MLRQLFHRLRPALHADFVAVELSDTFQTLSQRLEAMKHFKRHTRRQLFLIGCAISLLGTVAVVPWRVVAQEAGSVGRGEPVAIRLVDGNAATPAAEKPAEPQWGNLKGRFIYDGQPPAPVVLNINKDAQAFAGLNLVDESLIVANDGSLANVVVWVRTKGITIHPGYGGLKKLEATIQTLKGRFEPHVIPYWTGQPLKLRNLDSVATNINAAFQANQAFNVILPKKSSLVRPALLNTEVLPVALTDNIHPWLKCWVLVQPHPYTAVSEPDGRFELKNLPAGVPLEFQVWQERSGYVQKTEIDGKDAGWKKGRFTITLRPGENELGDIKLDPQQFKTQVGAQPPAAPPRAVQPPLGAQPGVAAANEQRIQRIRELGKQRVADLNKQLVGSWRGGDSDGILIFRADGTYEEFPRTLTESESRRPESARGRWDIEGDGRSGSLIIDFDIVGAALRGLPSLPGADQRGGTRFPIRHLDGTFLRLDTMGKISTLFFRRVEDRPEVPKYDSALPENIRKLAALAELSPEDASALAAPKRDWLKEWNVTDAQFKLLERISAARRGKIDLAELFELTKEEAAAFSELYLMTNGSFRAAQALADKGQLAPVEQAAVKKLVAARDELEQVIRGMKQGVAKITRSDPGLAPDIDSKTREALKKLQEVLIQLRQFLTATAFAEPMRQ